MNDEPRKPKLNWGSIFSLAIFLVFVFGRPLANLVQQLFQGTIPPFLGTTSFPWQGLLPLAIGAGALLLGAVVISRVLGVGSGDSRPPLGPPISLSQDPNIPQSPRFEPMFNPLLLVFAVVGFVALGIVGVLILQHGI